MMNNKNFFEELVKLIPEIKLIKDNNLQQKVAKAFEIALKEANLSLNDLLDFPFTLSVKNDNTTLVEHIRAVTQIAYQTACIFNQIYKDKGLKLDTDILIAGALLHDVAKLIEFKKHNGNYIKSDTGKLIRHPLYGALILKEAGLPKEVIHLVAYHSLEGDTQRILPEAIALNKIDFLIFDCIKIQREGG